MTPKNYEILLKAQSTCALAVTEVENANGVSKDSPFRDGLYADAEKRLKTAERFLDVLVKNLQGAQKGS